MGLLSKEIVLSWLNPNCLEKNGLSRLNHQDPLPCAVLVFKNRLLGLANFLGGKMDPFSQILIFSYLPLGWFKCPKTDGMAQVRV